MSLILRMSIPPLPDDSADSRPLTTPPPKRPARSLLSNTIAPQKVTSAAGQSVPPTSSTDSAAEINGDFVKEPKPNPSASKSGHSPGKNEDLINHNCVDRL